MKRKVFLFLMVTLGVTISIKLFNYLKIDLYDIIIEED